MYFRITEGSLSGDLADMEHFEKVTKQGRRGTMVNVDTGFTKTTTDDAKFTEQKQTDMEKPELADHRKGALGKYLNYLLRLCWLHGLLLSNLSTE